MCLQSQVWIHVCKDKSQECLWVIIWWGGGLEKMRKEREEVAFLSVVSIIHELIIIALYNR